MIRSMENGLVAAAEKFAVLFAAVVCVYYSYFSNNVSGTAAA